MKLEDQTTSLELSKKLKELGVKQESLFYWKPFYSITNDTEIIWDGGFNVIYSPKTFSTGQEVFKPWYSEMKRLEGMKVSAFTASELGELLPYQIDGAWLWLQKDPPIQGGWAIVYSKNVEFDNPLCIERGDTEVNVRAKMLIYLLENSLITL